MGTCGGLCGGEMRGESGRTGCIWSRVWGLVERRCKWVFWVVGGLWRVVAGRAEGVGLKSQ